MLDKITGLFRRATGGNGKTIPAAATPARAPTPPPAQDTAKQAELAARAESAARTLDADASPATASGIAQDRDLPAELRCRALARVSDPTLLRTLALDDRVARVRLAAATRLSAAEDLEVLRRESTDKAVQRHARDALKTQREQEQARRETQERIDHLLTAIAQHATRAFEPLYDAKLDSLESSWHAVAAHASPAGQERFAELAALARDTVRRHAAEIAARGQAIAAGQELISACQELENVVVRLRREDLADSQAAIAALRGIQRTRWEEAAGRTTVDAPLAARYRAAGQLLDAWLASTAELPGVAADASTLAAIVNGEAPPTGDVLDECQEKLDTLLARLAWPDGLHPPALVAELETLRQHLRGLQRAQQSDRREHLAQLRRRRHALKRMIDDGQLRLATRTHAWLRKRIDELPARDAEAERAALAPIEEALARLHDWYEFASVPKKTELCETAEALAAEAAGEDIAARSEQVRSLRDRWNTLCAADPDADPELRTRFEHAIGQAYAPCAAWYAAQRRVQDENLAKRAALCDALAAELAAIAPAGANWKALEQRERDARAAWKAAEPVRWPEARVLQERFSALIGEWRGKLEAERARNAGQRQELVTRAQALLAVEPVDAAISEARKLQDTWKAAAGYIDQREDRRLWGEFRTALDAVFARRDAARDADRSAREAAAAEAHARREAEDARRQQREQAVRDARRTEIDAALAVAAAEGHWLAGGSVDTTALAAAVDQANVRGALGDALRRRLERMSGSDRPAEAELAGSAATLAQLTLDLEILTDTPSPAELSAARMARKLERLQEALRGVRGNDDERRALENRWLATGPTTAQVHGALLARMRPVLGA